MEDLQHLFFDPLYFDKMFNFLIFLVEIHLITKSNCNKLDLNKNLANYKKVLINVTCYHKKKLSAIHK